MGGERGTSQVREQVGRAEGVAEVTGTTCVRLHVGKELSRFVQSPKVDVWVSYCGYNKYHKLSGLKQHSLFSYGSGSTTSTMGSSGGSRGERLPCLFLLRGDTCTP